MPCGRSCIKITLKVAANRPNQEAIIDIEGSTYKVVTVGKFSICKTGYVNLELQGVHKSGNYFADVSDVLITCSKQVRCVADDFYFGRRGPSIHLSYQLPRDKDISYFYNEISVPKGHDVVGAYFCAAGFHGGYFGIQVNSTEERRILFSIWSTYVTDNPACIPDQYKVRLIRKGDNVYVGEFGNEGAGGQSYLRYNWKSESKYKFLVNATPLTSHCNGIESPQTQFSAWFWSPEEDRWIFIATFLRQMESLHLRGIYSFSENFVPETGHIIRTARFGNQWVRDTNGCWHEIIAAQFTGDETSKRNRQDFAGGVVDGEFFLKNCGFFDECVQLNQCFERCRNHIVPNIDFDALP